MPYTTTDIEAFVGVHLKRPGDVPLTRDRIGEYVGRNFPDITAEALTAILDALVTARRLMVRPGAEYSWYWNDKQDDTLYYCLPEVYQQKQEIETEEWERQGIEDDAANAAFLILIERHPQEWEQLIAEQIAELTAQRIA